MTGVYGRNSIVNVKCLESHSPSILRYGNSGCHGPMLLTTVGGVYGVFVWLPPDIRSLHWGKKAPSNVRVARSPDIADFPEEEVTLGSPFRDLS